MLNTNQSHILTLKLIETRVFHIEPGYYIGFMPLEESSELLVFSDQTIEGPKCDDFRLTQEDLKW